MRRLETYRLPRRLRKAKAPDRLAPLFMDRAELAASPDLSDAMREAIADSNDLIVVCSPAAARSRWVQLEIQLFRELHPDRQILAALCRGDETDAFPRNCSSSTAEPRHRWRPTFARAVTASVVRCSSWLRRLPASRSTN